MLLVRHLLHHSLGSHLVFDDLINNEILDHPKIPPKTKPDVAHAMAISVAAGRLNSLSECFCPCCTCTMTTG